MANRTLVPRFSSPRHRILPPKFGYGILGIHRIFRICRLVCLLRLAVSKHGHPSQPSEILKITRTGLGVSTPIPKFSSLILVGCWWQTPGWRKHPKTLLFRSCKGCPHKSYKNATGQTRCSQRVIHFEPAWKKKFFPTKTWQTEPWSQGFHPLGTESYPQSLVLAFLAADLPVEARCVKTLEQKSLNMGIRFNP